VSTQVRERVVPVEARSVSAAKIPFGLNAGELIAAIVGIALLMWVAFYYFTSLKPEQNRLRALETDLAIQQKNILDNARPPGADKEKPVDMAKDAIESLEAFKNGHLKPFSSGRIDLIKEINALAKKHNVTLTSGIDMGASVAQPTDKAGAKPGKKDSSTRKMSDEISSAFPSVSFRFTVFGQYPQVRSFISDLEREKQFLVIDSINLSNQDARTSSKRGRGEGVSGIMLTIDMVAYFQPM
jgi:Type II secretion system (T2SS), protein M subtype b